jgi:glycosyltransferase involved in cell wall biosynthesis
LLARRGWRPFFLVVGTGPRREIDALRQLATDCGVADQLVLAGRQDDVRPYLDASDVFVHPSHDEPFGLAIVEAMAMAMPVVACDSGGVPEIVTEGRDGLLVPPRSASALAQALGRVRALPDKGATLGRAARSTVCARYTPAHAADAASAVWGRLCRNAGAGVPENA